MCNFCRKIKFLGIIRNVNVFWGYRRTFTWFSYWITTEQNVLSATQNSKLSKSTLNLNANIPNDLNKVNASAIHDSNNSSMYSPCFCNVVRLNEDMIICNNISCRVREYHKCCLVKLGKKRFGENWKCDTCKKAAKKSVVKKPLRKINWVYWKKRENERNSVIQC